MCISSVSVYNSIRFNCDFFHCVGYVFGALYCRPIAAYRAIWVTW